jgi:hypothetical protein
LVYEMMLWVELEVTEVKIVFRQFLPIFGYKGVAMVAHSVTILGHVCKGHHW